MERQLLEKEYLKCWNNFIVLPLKLAGWSRFDTKNGHIIPKTRASILYNILIVLQINACSGYIIYSLAIRDTYLWISEILVLVCFTMFVTCVLLNIGFFNAASGARIMNYFIDIDILLGVRQTKFIRQVAVRSYLFFCGVFAIAQILLFLLHIYTYRVDVITYPPACLYFYVLFFMYYDLIFFFAVFSSLTMRVRYLNVAIMKIANMKPNRLPKQFPFNNFFWTTKLDNLVDFHTRVQSDMFVTAFRMIYNQLYNFEKSYRILIFSNVIIVLIGAFVTVQNIITYVKSEVVLEDRLYAMYGWCILESFKIYILTEQMDMFPQQIKQTHLICTYIQLTPTHSDEIYELTSKVIGILENRDPRFNVYDIFHFDKGAILKLSSSLIVYITTQLQLAFPVKNDLIIKENSTLVG